MTEARHTYVWLTPHVWFSHVPHTNESRHTYEWVISRMRISHVTHTNKSGLCATHHSRSFPLLTWACTCEDSRALECRAARTTARPSPRTHHAHQYIMLHIWMSHITHINKWGDTDEQVTSHTSTSDVTEVTEMNAWSTEMNRWATCSCTTRLSRSYLLIWACTGVDCCAHNSPTHGACEWVVAHVNESWHMWISQVLPHVNKSGTCTTRHSRSVPLFTSNIWISHVAHMDESCHTYERVISPTWRDDVTGMNQGV